MAKEARIVPAPAEPRQLGIGCRHTGSARAIEPLCLSFWGGAWTLGAWCRLRQDFRHFRPDRIDSCAPNGEVCGESAERHLASYLRAVGGSMVDISQAADSKFC